MLQIIRNGTNVTKYDMKWFLWIGVALTVSPLLSACGCGGNEDEEPFDASVDSITCDGDQCLDAKKGMDAIDEQPDEAEIHDESSPPPSDRSCVSNDDCKKLGSCPGEVACVFDDDEDAGFVGTCECNCDSDGDSYLATRCGGNDCNDENTKINPGMKEVCDPFGVDEDCDSSTCSSEEGDPEVEDVDGDGYISIKCYNTNPLTGKRIFHKKMDCDDTRDDVYAGAVEKCDGLDNDCNDYIDERPNEKQHGGLRHTYFPDDDGDHWGSNEIERIRYSCNKPTGYVERSIEDKYFDCDDDDDTVYPFNAEVCDCKDNDCDKNTDEPDKDGGLLFDQPTFPETDVKCNQEKCRWEIRDGGCPEGRGNCNNYVLDGCESRLNTLSKCHKCETECRFSCGDDGCNEIEALDVGLFHACGITTEGLATCWGRNPDGRLGDDSNHTSSIPTEVVGINNVIEISAGAAHTCAIAEADRTLYCWGSNAEGQLGIGSEIDSVYAPEETLGRKIDNPTMTQTKSVAAGNLHTCAVYDEDEGEGRVACWGSQSYGRLGNGVNSEEDPIYRPVRVIDEVTRSYIENAKQVVAGEAHSCLLTEDNKIMCWGDNFFGQMGSDPQTSEYEWLRAQELMFEPELTEIDSLSAGFRHTCALLTSGRVICWGDNSQLQTGHPAGEDDYIPAEVTGLEGIIVKKIAAGHFHTCALSTDEVLRCWGSNNDGERGDDDIDPTEQPKVVDIGPVDLFAAGGISCGRMKESGRAACWGYNFYGQLGNGDKSREFQPKPQLLRALRGSIP